MVVRIEDHAFPWNAKLYPSGEFVIWRKQRETKQQRKESFVSAAAWLFVGRDLGEVFSLYGAEAVYRWWRTTSEVDVPRVRPYPASPVNACPVDGWKNFVCDLGSSALANSKKRRRGMSGLTSHGKVFVRESATGLQDRYGKWRLTFWTCTLPRLTDWDTVSVCQNWSKILHNLRLKLAYHLKAANLPSHIVGVTELQAARWEESRYPAWHIHWVFVGRHRGKPWAISRELGDKLWKEAVETYCTQSYNFESSCQLASVKKNVAGYLAKYLSKGGGVIAEVEELYPGSVPSSWYVLTAKLRNWVKKCTRRSEGIAKWLYQRLHDDIGSIIAPWAFQIQVRPGVAVAVCWLGRIPDPPVPLHRLS